MNAGKPWKQIQKGRLERSFRVDITNLRASALQACAGGGTDNGPVIPPVSLFRKIQKFPLERFRSGNGPSPGLTPDLSRKRER
jgi:hypothetical protein